MKKVLMTLALVAVAATSAFAQISVGAGYLANTQKSSYTSGSTTTTTTTPQSGFYAGADYTLDMGQGLGLAAGLKASLLSDTHTTTILGISGTTKTTEIYLGVPVQFNYSYALSNDLRLFALAGPTFSLGLSSKSKFTNNVNDDVTITDNYGDDSDYKKFNVLLGAAAGVDVMNTIRIKVGYDLGLLNRSAADNTKVNDAQWYVGVAYLF
ncbi:MAG: PorT family protein [Bacteroidales bacterium]|nr:PorT family protein [Bacteroidales bacterium]